jgi:hypothetical protein
MSDNLIELLKGTTPTSIRVVQLGQLNAYCWQLAGVPLGDGKYWMYQDRNAWIKLIEDGIEIEIQKFSNSHDQVQIFDNPKHLYLTTDGYEPGPGGLVGFACTMKAAITNGNLEDYRDGFCAFNALDFGSGMVFDIVSNGHKIWAIYERLLIPGLTSSEQAFTNVIPIDRLTSAEETLHCAIIYDRNNDIAEYYIAGEMIGRAENIPVKVDKLQTGFGIITLHPIENGKSVSCRGQGGRGVWGGFEVFSK